jgi:hypothetical protein
MTTADPKATKETVQLFHFILKVSKYANSSANFPNIYWLHVLYVLP